MLGCRCAIIEVREALEWLAEDRLDGQMPGASCPDGRHPVHESSLRYAGLHAYAMEHVSPELARRLLKRLKALMEQRTPREIKKKIHKNRPFGRVH